MIKSILPFVWKGSFSFSYREKVIEKILSLQKTIEYENVLEESGKAFSTVLYDQFRPHLSDCFSEFYSQLYQDLVSITSPKKKIFSSDKSWFNLHYETGVTNEHNHSPANYVCSFYINAPTNSGRIMFKINNKFVPVEISTGDYLIFAGGINHKTEASLSPEPRIVATTNIFSIDS